MKAKEEKGKTAAKKKVKQEIKKKAAVKAIIPAITEPAVFTQELKIPKDRVGVLVGKKGEIKRWIEKKADVKLIISKEGDVIISGKDNIMLYDVKIVVQAIGRGFSPEKAVQLFNEANTMEIMDITEYAGKSKKKLDRLRGRVIGENGRARRSVEELTETDISVYGKTVAIIGEIEMAAIARSAVDMLLSGAPHGAVYRMLENKRREFHRRRVEVMAGVK